MPHPAPGRSAPPRPSPRRSGDAPGHSSVREIWRRRWAAAAAADATAAAAPFHAPLAEVHSEVGKENEKTAALGAAGKRARRCGEAPPKTMKTHLNLDAAEGESWETLNLE